MRLVKKIKNSKANKFFVKHFFSEKFLKFIIVGLINTSITLLTIYILYNCFNWNYKIANVVGYIFGLINSFILNKYWTFKSRFFSIKEMIYFLGMFVISFSFQFVFVFLLVDFFHIDINLSQFCGMVVYTLTNFLGNKIITFKI